MSISSRWRWCLIMLSYRQLKTVADQLKDQLEKVPALKKIKVSGAPEQVIRVDLLPDKIAALKIPLNLIIGSLQSEAANIPGEHYRRHQNL